MPNIPKGYNYDGEFTGSADPTHKLKDNNITNPKSHARRRNNRFSNQNRKHRT